MEITEIDRNLTYFKVLNESENHNGLQYHTGLVEDMLPFESDPERSCVKGRIYITTLENLPIFFDYGCWIRPCWIPEDAQALIDPQGDKIGVDKVVFGDRLSFAEYFGKIFDPERIDLKDSWILVRFCSDYFDKWFDPDKYNWGYSWALARYCSDYFDKWFDPERYNWGYSWALAKYCPDKKHIWGKYIQEV
jgi:hypothetical protein